MVTRIRVVALLCLTIAVVTPAPSSAERRAIREYAQLTRYSLVHGCYEVRTKSGRQLGPFSMQATALGQYLLYGVHADFLGPGLAQVSTPERSTIWRVDGNARRGFKLTNMGTGSTLPVTFSPARGCVAYPEAEVNATGTPFKGASPGATVRGTIDGHAHVMFFEAFGGNWHCGRPWDPYGAPYALPDCASIQGPQGSAAPSQNFLDYGEPAHPHDTVGWPRFHDWPGPARLSEEFDYYTGIQRAWMDGMRLMVVQLVDNEAFCQVLPLTRRNPCNDMSSVRIEARDTRLLQDYIDAQSGGPGKGWFRIVTNPFQARRVANNGKLAVVLSIELSRVLGCGEHFGVPECNRSQVDSGLNELHRLGIAGFFPIHKFDNAFGGTKMDGGETGVLVNTGNHLETGQYWDVQTCAGPEHDQQQLTAPLSTLPGLNELLNGPLHQLLPTGSTLPVYPSGPSCNTRGLTDLGGYLLRQMIKRHMIIELDHMDVKTANAALAIIQAHRYAGVVSSHSWDSQLDHPQIYRVGGTITPYPSAPQGGVKQWLADRQASSRRFLFGYGFGSDANGLASQPGPEQADAVTYPFKSLDGHVTFQRERWGQRVFDLNTDGVANYGLYPDLIAAQARIGGPRFVDDMMRGAEAYLEMWERAYGVHKGGCILARQLTPGGLGKLRLGASYSSALRTAGQPRSRSGRSYRYCAARAVFGSGGKIAFIASTAAGTRAGQLRVGAPAHALNGRAGKLAPGLFASRRLPGGKRFVYGITAGHVRYVAIANGSEAGNAGALRADVGAAGL